MEDLAAEIEYIKIKGVSYTPRECKKCQRGRPNENSTLCEPCPMYRYYDEQSSKCQACRSGTYAKMDKHGVYSCVKSEPCTEIDYYADYGECDKSTMKRKKSYKWKDPSICNLKSPQSVILPFDEMVPCRGCGRGEFRSPDTNECEYCDPGMIQPINNHMNE